MTTYNAHGHKSSARRLAQQTTVQPLPDDAGAGWPVDYHGWEFYPIPESWLNHARAYDRHETRSADRLYAVSAAASGGFIYVRYCHPRVPGVQVKQTNWIEIDNGYVPRALTTQGWPRSIAVDKDQPETHYTSVESRHMHDIWPAYSDEIDSDAELLNAMADGGPLFGGER